MSACRQFAALTRRRACRFTGLEFAVAFGDAIELLTATHSHLELQALFTGPLDARILHGSLLLAITRLFDIVRSRKRAALGG